MRVTLSCPRLKRNIIIKRGLVARAPFLGGVLAANCAVLIVRCSVAASIIMKVSNWFAVFEAYQNACKQAEAKYQIARNTNEIDTRLARLADFIAGQQNEKDDQK